MSSDPSELRFSARRASLHAALRDRDVLAAARAAARLRVDGFPITPDEFARAAAMRRSLGIALVKARMPSAPAPSLRVTATPPKRRSRLRLVAGLALIAELVLIVLFFPRDPGVAGGGSPPRVITQPVATAVLVSRGRTISAPIEVVVEASPTPEPSPQPTEAPAASLRVAAAATGTPGLGGSGSGTSTGTGTGTGSGSGSGTSTQTPAPTATPIAVRPGFSRLNVIVYDAQTLRPLPDVCVVIGTLDCGTAAPHTDANGRWSADVAATPATTLWDLSFIKARYATQRRQITLPGGVSRTYVIYLRRQG